MTQCDLPMYFSLCDWWKDVPPAAVQLRRIASFIGIKPDAQPSAKRMASGAAKPSTPNDVAFEAAQAGMPVFQGRPADPMLDLIPSPPPAQQP